MVASRRDLLRTMGGAAAALATRRPSAAQTFTATSISQAAQDARREVGLLGRRADNLLRLTVADGLERGAAASVPGHGIRERSHGRSSPQ